MEENLKMFKVFESFGEKPLNLLRSTVISIDKEFLTHKYQQKIFTIFFKCI